MVVIYLDSFGEWLMGWRGFVLVVFVVFVVVVIGFFDSLLLWYVLKLMMFGWCLDFLMYLVFCDSGLILWIYLICSWLNVVVLYLVFVVGKLDLVRWL